MSDDELFPDEPLNSSTEATSSDDEFAELEVVDLDDSDEMAAPIVDSADEHEQATEPETKTVYRGSGVRWGFVAGLALAVLLVILVFQNTDPVSFQFLIWEIETPLAALLIATAVIAAVADELVGLVVRARRRRRLAEKEELEKLRQQNQA